MNTDEKLQLMCIHCIKKQGYAMRKTLESLHKKVAPTLADKVLYCPICKKDHMFTDVAK